MRHICLVPELGVSCAQIVRLGLRTAHDPTDALDLILVDIGRNHIIAAAHGMLISPDIIFREIKVVEVVHVAVAFHGRRVGIGNDVNIPGGYAQFFQFAPDKISCRLCAIYCGDVAIDRCSPNLLSQGSLGQQAVWKNVPDCLPADKNSSSRRALRVLGSAGPYTSRFPSGATFPMSLGSWREATWERLMLGGLILWLMGVPLILVVLLLIVF